jgi:hypothetical protein
LAQTQGLQGLAGQTENEYQNRLQAQQAISQALFSGQQGSATNLANLYGAAGQEQQNIAKGLEGLAADTSQQRMARMAEQDQLTQNAAQNYLSMLTQQGNTANMNATQQLAFLNGQSDAAQRAGQSYLDMLTQGSNAAQNASTANLNRLTNYGTLATNVDTGNRNALNDYLSAGVNAQTAQQQRLQSMYLDALGLGGAQANIVTGQGDVGLQSYENMIANAMGLSGNAAALNAQAAQMPFQDLLALGGLGVGAYTAYQGGQPKTVINKQG